MQKRPGYGIVWGRYLQSEELFMTLMDYCMQYIGEIMDGKRAAPEGVTLTETDPIRRSLELLQKAGDIPTLVRMCAAQDGTEIPQEVFDSFDRSP